VCIRLRKRVREMTDKPEKCGNCDSEQVELVARAAAYECGDCGAYLQGVDVVDKAELRELIEKWREYGSPADEACADELEAILDE
jgi:ribosomal protein L37AE/L43A